MCGAIFRAAGPRLDDACVAAAPCATGDAVATPAFDLPARWVIHAVGPVWRGGHDGEPAQLASCYRRTLEVAVDVGARTVAIPALSTGIYGYPTDEAAAVAVSTLTAADARRLDEVVLVAFDDATYRRYERLLTAEQ